MLRYLSILILSALFVREIKAEKLPGLIPFNDHGKWGYADTTGKLIIPLQFDVAFPFQNNYAVVANKVERKEIIGSDKLEFNLIDKAGNVLLTKWYQSINMNECNTLIIIKENNLYGVMNNDFEIITPCIYDYIHPFQGDLARVSKFSYYGIINNHGKEIVPCKYRYIYPFNDSVACFAIINTISDFNSSIKFGYLNKAGDVIIEPVYNEATSFYKGFAFVKKGNTYSRINKNGKDYSLHDYEKIENFTDGIAMVYKEKKYGFINSEGIEIVPCIYSDAIPFSEGLGSVKKGGFWFYVDKQGKRAFDGDYAEAYPFSEGLAMVVKGGRCGFIDKIGSLISEYRWNDAGSYHNGLVWVKVSKYYGFIDTKYQLKIGIKYKGVGDFKNGICPVYPDRKHEKQLELNSVLPDYRYFFIDKYGREYYNGAAF